MLRIVNRRLIAALAISIALHTAIFMLPVIDIVAQNGMEQSLFSVNLVSSAQDTPTVDSSTRVVHHDAPTFKTSAVVDSAPGLVSNLPVEDRYFLFDEVDKGAAFIYAAPIENLELINSADAMGRVKVMVLINESGNVDSAAVLEAEPSNIYNGVALRALLNSRFFPAEKDGKKVKSGKILEIKFGTQRDN